MVARLAAVYGRHQTHLRGKSHGFATCLSARVALNDHTCVSEVLLLKIEVWRRSRKYLSFNCTIVERLGIAIQIQCFDTAFYCFDRKTLFACICKGCEFCLEHGCYNGLHFYATEQVLTFSRLLELYSDHAAS